MNTNTDNEKNINFNSARIINSQEFITRVFDNISAESLNQSNKLFKVWREILESIKSNSINGNNIGKNMAAHSRIIDLKNEILLIEADHPGWIQMIKTYQKFILIGLKKKIPELKISSLSFRVAGTNHRISDGYNGTEEIQIKKEFEKMNKTFELEEQILKDKGYSVSAQNKPEKREIPEELKKIFSVLNMIC